MTSAFTARLATGLTALALLIACGGGPAEGGTADSERAEPPDQIVFVYDRSGSVEDHEILHYQALTEKRLADLRHGDRIVAIEILQLSLDEEPRRWAQQVPAREYVNRTVRSDSLSRVRFIQDARDYLQRFSDTGDRDGFLGTDILSTLHLVAEEAKAYPEHRTTVVLFSDMLQATREINMEGLVRMPTANWVQDAWAAGRLPDLSGVCVVAAGVRTDTQPAQVVRRFWEEYFEVTGATLRSENYSYWPVRIPTRPCP